MGHVKSPVLAFGWVSGAQYLSTTIRFLGGVYLARMIEPTFFGQQGLALSMVMLMLAFVMVGESHALIRQQRNVRAYMKMLLCVRLSIVIILSTVIIFLWKLGCLPGTKQVQFYTVLLFFSQIPAQIASVYIAYITKRMFFRRLAFMNLVSTCAGVSLACVLAHLGYTIWALLWLFMAEQLVLAILAILFTGEFFLPKFSKNVAYEFFHYSKYFITTSILDRFSGKIGDICIGSFVGEASLGYYRRAYGLGSLLQTMVVGGLGTVAQPYFAKMQGDRNRFGRNFEFVSSLLIRISCPAYACLALILPDVIGWLYGEKWLPTVLLFRLLLPFAILQSFRMNLRNIHKVAGSVKLLTISQAAEVLSMVIFLFPLIYWRGVLGVVIAVDISTILGVGFMLFYLRQFADFSIRKIFANPLIATLSAMLVTALAVWGTGTKFIDMHVTFIIALFASTYLMTLLVLEYPFIKQVGVLLTSAARMEKA